MTHLITDELRDLVKKEIGSNLNDIRVAAEEWLQRPESGGVPEMVQSLRDIRGALLLLGNEHTAELAEALAAQFEKLASLDGSKLSGLLDNGGQETLATVLLILEESIFAQTHIERVEANIAHANELLALIDKGAPDESKIGHSQVVVRPETWLEVSSYYINKIDEYIAKIDRVGLENLSDLLSSEQYQQMTALADVLFLFELPELGERLRKANNALADIDNEQKLAKLAETILMVRAGLIERGSAVASVEINSDAKLGKSAFGVSNRETMTRLGKEGEYAFSALRKATLEQNQINAEQCEECALLSLEAQALSLLLNLPRQADVLQSIGSFCIYLTTVDELDEQVRIDSANILVGAECLFQDMLHQQFHSGVVGFLEQVSQRFFSSHDKTQLDKKLEKLLDISHVDDAESEQVISDETAGLDGDAALEPDINDSLSKRLAESQLSRLIRQKNVEGLEELTAPRIKERFIQEDESAEVDEEIREIFMEEFSELVVQGREFFDQWMQGDESQMLEVRRIFHTLKGSGRMAQLESLGEFAWQVESLLNHVRDGAIEADEDVRYDVEDTILLLELMVEHSALTRMNGAMLRAAAQTENLLEEKQRAATEADDDALDDLEEISDQEIALSQLDDTTDHAGALLFDAEHSDAHPDDLASLNKVAIDDAESADDETEEQLDEQEETKEKVQVSEHVASSEATDEDESADETLSRHILETKEFTDSQEDDLSGSGEQRQHDSAEQEEAEQSAFNDFAFDDADQDLETEDAQENADTAEFDTEKAQDFAFDSEEEFSASESQEPAEADFLDFDLQDEKESGDGLQELEDDLAQASDRSIEEDQEDIEDFSGIDELSEDIFAESNVVEDEPRSSTESIDDELFDDLDEAPAASLDNYADPSHHRHGRPASTDWHDALDAEEIFDTDLDDLATESAESSVGGVSSTSHAHSQEPFDGSSLESRPRSAVSLTADDDDDIFFAGDDFFSDIEISEDHQNALDGDDFLDPAFFDDDGDDDYAVRSTGSRTTSRTALPEDAFGLPSAYSTEDGVSSGREKKVAQELAPLLNRLIDKEGIDGLSNPATSAALSHRLSAQADLHDLDAEALKEQLLQQVTQSDPALSAALGGAVDRVLNEDSEGLPLRQMATSREHFRIKDKDPWDEAMSAIKALHRKTGIHGAEIDAVAALLQGKMGDDTGDLADSEQRQQFAETLGNKLSNELGVDDSYAEELANKIVEKMGGVDDATSAEDSVDSRGHFESLIGDGEFEQLFARIAKCLAGNSEADRQEAQQLASVLASEIEKDLQGSQLDGELMRGLRQIIMDALLAEDESLDRGVAEAFLEDVFHQVSASLTAAQDAALSSDESDEEDIFTDEDGIFADLEDAVYSEKADANESGLSVKLSALQNDSDEQMNEGTALSVKSSSSKQTEDEEDFAGLDLSTDAEMQDFEEQHEELSPALEDAFADIADDESTLEMDDLLSDHEDGYLDPVELTENVDSSAEDEEEQLAEDNMISAEETPELVDENSFVTEEDFAEMAEDSSSLDERFDLREDTAHDTNEAFEEDGVSADPAVADVDDDQAYTQEVQQDSTPADIADLMSALASTIQEQDTPTAQVTDDDPLEALEEQQDATVFSEDLSQEQSELEETTVEDDSDTAIDDGAYEVAAISEHTPDEPSIDTDVEEDIDEAIDNGVAAIEVEDDRATEEVAAEELMESETDEEGETATESAYDSHIVAPKPAKDPEQILDDEIVARLAQGHFDQSITDWPIPTSSRSYTDNHLGIEQESLDFFIYDLDDRLARISSGLERWINQEEENSNVLAEIFTQLSFTAGRVGFNALSECARQQEGLVASIDPARQDSSKPANCINALLAISIEAMANRSLSAYQGILLALARYTKQLATSMLAEKMLADKTFGEAALSSQPKKALTGKDMLRQELRSISSSLSVRASGNSRPVFSQALSEFDALIRQAKSKPSPELIPKILETLYDIEETLAIRNIPAGIWNLLDAVEQMLHECREDNSIPDDDYFNFLKDSADLVEKFSHQIDNFNRDSKPDSDLDSAIEQLMQQRNKLVAGRPAKQSASMSSSLPHKAEDHDYAMAEGEDDQPTHQPDSHALEVFLDEAKDIVAEANNNLEQWVESPAQVTFLTDIARSMHSLLSGATPLNYRQIASIADAIERLADAICDGVCTEIERAGILIDKGLDAVSDMLLQIEAGQKPRTDSSVCADIEALLTGETVADEEPEVASEIVHGEDGHGEEVTAETENYPAVVGSTSADETTEQSEQEEYEQDVEEPRSAAVDDAEQNSEEHLPADIPEPEAVEEISWDEDLLEIFIDEAQELLRLAKQQVQKNIAEAAVRNELQRAMHTLKGGARMVGLAVIGYTAHLMESVIEKTPTMTAEQLEAAREVLMEGLEAHTMMLDSAIRHEMPAAPTQTDNNLIRFINRLSEITSPRSKPETIQPETDAASTQQSPAAAEASESAQASAPEQPVSNFASVKEALESARGQESPEQSGGDTGKQERSGGRQVRVSEDMLESLTAMVGEAGVLRVAMDNIAQNAENSLNELDRIAERIDEQLRRMGSEAEAQILFRREASNVDGDFDPLEMDRFSEMQQLSRQLAEAIDDLKNTQQAIAGEISQYRGLSVQQTNIHHEVQERLMSAQMLRFDVYEGRLRRLVNQASRSVDKQVQLVLEGGKVEIERRLLDELLPPLEHIVRNAIAHGIEMPRERRAAGKPEQGVIKIDARTLPNEIIVRVIDDGRGINYEKIRESARKKGILDEKRADDEQYLNSLLLQAGVSASEKVTQLSGRGVGLDVVNDMLKRRRGQIGISTIEGEGTEFNIVVPSGMSIVDVLLIAVAGETYAIPMGSITSVIQLDDAFAERIRQGSEEPYNYRGRVYPVVSMGRYLSASYDLPKGVSTLPGLVIDLPSGEGRVFQIDRVINRLEVVIKDIYRQASVIPGVMGATVMADGRVLPIMSMADLIRRLDVVTPLAQTDSIEDRPARVMIVDDSVTMRKVGTRLLTRNGYETEAAKDGVDALEMLPVFEPDIILLDIEMPRMDGFEFAHQLRAQGRYADTPVVMITSRTGDKHRAKAAEAGVSEYLGKPYREEELLSVISRLLNK